MVWTLQVAEDSLDCAVENHFSGTGAYTYRRIRLGKKGHLFERIAVDFLSNAICNHQEPCFQFEDVQGIL
jgi:hypothetical protein